MSKINYTVSFEIDIAYPKSRFNRKSGTIGIYADGVLDTETLKTDKELILFITKDVQPKI
jgi:hypothetical protein